MPNEQRKYARNFYGRVFNKQARNSLIFNILLKTENSYKHYKQINNVQKEFFRHLIEGEECEGTEIVEIAGS